LFRTVQRVLLLILVVVLFLKPFLYYDLTVITFLLTAGVVFTALLSIDIKDLIGSLAVGICGIVITFGTNQPFVNLMKGTGSMMDFIGVLAIMQLFGIPLQLGSYKRDFAYLVFKYLKKEKHLYLLTTLSTQFFGTFLSLGAIPIIVSLLGESLRNNVQNYTRFISTATSRGYALMTSWAPGAATVLLVLSITHLEWNQIFLPGFILSIMGIITSGAYEEKLSLKPGPYSLPPADNEPIQRDTWQSMRNLVIVVLSIIMIILILEKTKKFSPIYCIMLAGITVLSIWIIKYRKSPYLKKYGQKYWNEGLAKTVDLTVLFTAIGILTEAIKNSNLLDLLYTWVPMERLGYFTIVVIPLSIILLSLTGLHPLVSVMVVGNVFMANPNIPIIGLSTALMLGAMVSYCVSPFAGIVLTSAKFVNRTSRELAWKWNGVFALLLLAEGTVFIYLLIALFL